MKQSPSLERITDMTDYGPSKSTLKNKFLNLDLFGQPVTFSIRGREKFDTYLGATCSILMMLFMFIVAVSVTVKAFTENDVQEYQSLKIPDYFSSSDVIDMNGDGLMFAVGVSSTSRFEYESQEKFTSFAEWDVKLIK